MVKTAVILQLIEHSSSSWNLESAGICSKCHNIGSCRSTCMRAVLQDENAYKRWVRRQNLKTHKQWALWKSSLLHRYPTASQWGNLVYPFHMGILVLAYSQQWPPFVFLGSSLRLTMSFAAITSILGFDCPPFILPLFLLPPSPQPPSWPAKAPRCPRMTRRLSPARSAGGTPRRIAKPSGSTSGTASSSWCAQPGSSWILSSSTPCPSAARACVSSSTVGSRSPSPLSGAWPTRCTYWTCACSWRWPTTQRRDRAWKKRMRPRADPWLTAKATWERRRAFSSICSSSSRCLRLRDLATPDPIFLDEHITKTFKKKIFFSLLCLGEWVHDMNSCHRFLAFCSLTGRRHWSSTASTGQAHILVCIHTHKWSSTHKHKHPRDPHKRFLIMLAWMPRIFFSETIQVYIKSEWDAVVFVIEHEWKTLITVLLRSTVTGWGSSFAGCSVGRSSRNAVPRNHVDGDDCVLDLVSLAVPPEGLSLGLLPSKVAEFFRLHLRQHLGRNRSQLDSLLRCITCEYVCCFCHPHQSDLFD